MYKFCDRKEKQSMSVETIVSTLSFFAICRVMSCTSHGSEYCSSINLADIRFYILSYVCAVTSIHSGKTEAP